MKYFLQLIFLFSVGILFGQSQRLVFIEEFTQASCPPCEATTPALNAIIGANTTKIVQMRYQTSWPGVDPMNKDNASEVQSRVDYYGVQGVPTVLADGVETADFGVLPQATIDARYATTSPVSITVEHSFSADSPALDVVVKIKNEGTTAYTLSNDKLRVALIEEEISWNSPPGSTSITVFEAVMKKFFTTTAGVDVPEIAGGDTYELTLPAQALPSTIYNYNQLAVVAFIQNEDTKAIINSGQSEAKAIFPDLSISDKSTTASGYCDYAITPSTTVFNIGGTEIPDYTVTMFVNGVEINSVDVTNAIPVGGSADVNFPSTDLPGGTSVVEFVVSTIDGDAGFMNNFSKPLVVGKASLGSDLVESGFENDEIGALPANGIIERPFENLNFITVNAEAITASEPIGGFGTSDKSVIVNFWQWDNSQIDPNGFMIIADQFNVPSSGAKLSFDYAYTSWSGSSDRLKVQISDDCGETFNDVFNKAGAALRTAPEVNLDNTFFKPTANQWKTIDIDLSAYVGKTIMARFAVVSSWGDMLYLDNVNFTPASGIEDLQNDESLSIVPNPATNLVSLELNTNAVDNVTYAIVDAIGRTVSRSTLVKVGNGRFVSNEDVSNLNSGLYFVKFNLGDRQVTEKLNVVR